MKPTIPLLLLAGLVNASSGDQNTRFQYCLQSQKSQRCTPDFQLPLSLRLTRWTCEEDCKYRCSHIVTDIAIREGRQIEQYYGKWAFWRYMGIQEPLSVLFSVLNLWAHLRGSNKLRRGIARNHPMRPYYNWFTVVNVNLWFWSCVYHTRDWWWTERLDYFAAGLGVIYSVYYSVVRLYHLYLKPGSLPYESTFRHHFLVPWGVLCTVLYIVHVFYLSVLPRFDYGWNMKVNLTVGVLHNLLWMAYSLPYPPFQRFRTMPNSYRPSYVFHPALIVLTMFAAISLEIIDFPPLWRTIDAHSLWHLATVPIVWKWYDFLIKDAQDPSWRDRMLT
ncbi:related to PER1 protein, involved in manganese homeostasis [Serendipita indica DSM 11827]|uniref:Post-GPI attachment to proteins factor 3 n=1 Tax=Serendipita indica (strain DSM 11827) TaxID=1109443 RepID=G4TSS8_SERID|nr:related to PER1 protein, involved in manganese homeostasis [Serendipita indica DSM 11827]